MLNLNKNLKRATNIINTLKQIYVNSIFITLVFVFGTIKKDLPITPVITKDVLNLAFYIGCTLAVIQILPMIKYSNKQLRAMGVILIRMLIIGLTLGSAISSALIEDYRFAIIASIFTLVNIRLFKYAAHNEAIKILLSDNTLSK